MEKKLILFLSADLDDPDYDKLQLIKECNDVADKIKSTKHGNEVDFRQRHEISVERIQEIIADNSPQIVHFTGHGEKEHLLLEGIDGQTEQAKAEALADMFGILNNRMRARIEGKKILCVVLSACYSRQIAKAVAKHVDFVVGMSNEVREDTAKVFAESFYRHLCSGESFGDAFELAKNQIELLGIPGQDIPKLEKRNDIDPFTVFLFAAEPAAPRIELPTVTKEEGTPKRTLLPDSTKIAKLSIDSDLLDQIYEQARTQAVGQYDDAEMAGFSIVVFPFRKLALGAKVSIYLNFYSRYADRLCTFSYNDHSERLEHLPPDKRAKRDEQRKVFTKLPWKKMPHWMEFLERAFARIGPLPSASQTHYFLSAWRLPGASAWHLMVFDGFSGDEMRFEWDGKGLDEHNIRQVE